MPQAPLWQSRFAIPAAAVDLFLDALETDAISVAAFEEPAADGADGALWRVELLHQAEPDREALAARIAPLAERSGLRRIDLTVAPVAATDWLARTAESFPAQPIGRFWVHGSHIAAPPPAHAVSIAVCNGEEVHQVGNGSPVKKNLCSASGDVPWGNCSAPSQKGSRKRNTTFSTRPIVMKLWVSPRKSSSWTATPAARRRSA